MLRDVGGVLLGVCLSGGTLAAGAALQGERARWQPVTLTFDGPRTSESATPNPFRDYRLNVTFRHAASGKAVTVPGYFAADGNAAETSAREGSKWRVRFLPDTEGEWRYRVSFRTGPDVALSPDAGAGRPAAFDGQSGSFRVRAADQKAAGFHRKGLLEYAGGHHFRFAGTGEYFLKGGADSPENFLAYEEFDDTYDADADSGSYKAVGTFIHRYAPHVKDWQPGDPSWRGGKGKGIIGALNYLASKGVNSVYFLTYNLDGGDGRDTWMWTDAKTRDRFDVSKLEQWEIVFSHMDRKGLMLHVVTQETENDDKLGGFGLTPLRKLYLRELCARFSHHLALIWNLGEENDTPDPDRKEIARYIRSLDACRHPITVHSHNNRQEQTYAGLYGDPFFEATSIQGRMENYNADAILFRRLSAQAGRKWAVFGDEQPPASIGVMPDEADPDHDVPRVHALWGNLIGGGSGVEWYFGSKYPHMDINLEDFRSRDRLWDQTRHALEFFRRHLPFWEMAPDNGLATGAKDARVLARGEDIYAVQLPAGGEASLRLGPGDYRIQWYNPRTGGELQWGSVRSAKGPGIRPIGLPPAEGDRDWVALVRR